MTPGDIQFLSEFLRKRSGLVLTPDKAYLLENRLRPLVRLHGVADIAELIAKLRSGAIRELEREIVEAMTTNESFFFRDIKPFDNFRDNILPRLLESRATRRKIRIWCAAASTGQEPYSLAMILADATAKLGAWGSVEILATDLDTDVLNRAKNGVYTQFEVQRGLPVQYLVKYFEKDGDKWRINQKIRSMVTYREHNLLESPAKLGKFDVVFCRNVLIYFDSETKAKVLEGISKMLPADGVLFLGGAETVLGVSDCFKPVPDLRGIYELNGAAAVPAFVAAKPAPVAPAIRKVSSG